ncbi:MAG: hypothetical protein DMF63_07530 [Acidobacteria bacterium]|nr:MAG: hypothetical protein DMF63_07530 [Acidobacteriota bacterium]
MKNNLYEALALIHSRPGLYIGEESINLLSGWIDGWRYALADEAFDGTSPPFGEFHDWVALRLGLHESTAGWRRMLLTADNGDDKAAFDHFFVLFDEFRNRRSRIILHARADQSRKPADWLDTAERKVLPWPHRLEIIRYTDDKGVFLRFIDEDGQAYRDEYCIDLDCALDRSAGMVDREEWKTNVDCD